MNTFKYVNVGDRTIWKSDDNLHNKHTSYCLDITPVWKSSLNGNPSAILVEATHADADDNGTYTYNCLWANYNTSSTEYVFKEHNLDLDDSEIVMYEPYEDQTNKLYINHPIVQKKDRIIIQIANIYSGVISFKLTPIMSYGPLPQLAKTINLDQSKIASGEIVLSKWGYNVKQFVGSVIRKSNPIQTTSEEITTTVNTTTNNNQTVEKKYVVTKQQVENEDPSEIINYKYYLTFNYGFDSYVFDEQRWTDNRYIKFYDLQTIDINSFGTLTANEIIEKIINDPQYVPEHVEKIPSHLLYGGSTTISYTLNTSECRLKPNNGYLVIIQVESLINNTDGSVTNFKYFDYRYLFTSTIFNENYGQIDDFNTLGLPIVPTMTIKFDDTNRINSQFRQNNKEISQAKLLKQFIWISQNKSVNADKVTFKYNLEINNSPSDILFEYTNNQFSTKVNSKYNFELDRSLNINFTSENFESIKYNTDILKTSIENNKDFSENVNDINSSSKLIKQYEFIINRNVLQTQTYINSVKTNLLNIDSSTDQYGLYLSEANGLSNTMMFQDDMIFTAGMHNDGDDDGDEEWYGELGSASEGYTHSLPTREYDDSYSANSINELDLKNYNADLTDFHYYLKHGDVKIQFGSEKDDAEEELATYLNSNDANKALSKNLNTRGLVPLLFVTSGYSGDESDKRHNNVFLKLESFVAASQPADGNIDLGEDYNEEEKNNFNETHPYWFLEWSKLNYREIKHVMGTFLLKYFTNKNAPTYVTTNNYFIMKHVSANSPAQVFYIEDLNVTYNNKKPSLEYTHIIPSGKSYVTTINDPDTYSLSQTLDVKNQTLNYFSLGDLFATQLAQFCAVKKYTTPILFNEETYTISDSDKNILKNLEKEQIIYKSQYKLTLKKDSKVYKELNQNLTYNDINLSDWNNKLKSNNLIISLPEEGQVFIQNEDLRFNPLIGVLPDVKETSYMLEISPYGNKTYKSSPDTVNILYYWDDQNSEYVPYDNKKQIYLYKYGKFSKFIGNTSSLDFVNPNNYERLNSEFDETLEKFIKFHPYKNNAIIQSKHIVEIPLSYNQSDGLYTNNKNGRTAKMSFQYNNDYADPEGETKYISGISHCPRCYKTGNNNFKHIVDTTQRI